jgi:molybdenum cofactor synthesis domain-containing protein
MEPRMISAAVITCSNRSAAGERADESGQLLAAAVAGWGYQVAREVVPDEVSAIRAAVQRAVTGGARLVLTTGGTGVTPTDVTPEAVGPLLERPIPGISERIRAVNVDRVPTAVLSRGVSGMVGNALVVTLPGSPGGVRDALGVLEPLIGHVLDQAAGGDHRPGGGI